MATTLKTLYGTATAITCTLASLASAGARQSILVDNTTNLWLDMLIGGQFTSASGSLGTNPVVNIYVAALSDGTNYAGGATGSDAAYTMPANTGNLILLASVPINTAATVETFEPRSIAAAFGGNVPAKFALIVQNSTGLALHASSANTLYYTGLQAQNV